MTRRTFPLFAGAALAVLPLLAACGDADTAENETVMTADVGPALPGADAVGDNMQTGNDSSPTSPDSSEPGSSLPPEGGLRFIGMWASEAENCGDLAWRFTRDELRTPAGSVCSFTNMETVDGGYDISARCTAEGPPEDDNLKIRFAESAKAMLFESESIADAGLIYCGPPE